VQPGLDVGAEHYCVIGSVQRPGGERRERGLHGAHATIVALAGEQSRGQVGQPQGLRAGDGLRSITTSTPASAANSPLPETTSTPCARDISTTATSRALSLAITRDPAVPVDPMTPRVVSDLTRFPSSPAIATPKIAVQTPIAGV
jgi:hypothetical protein